MALAFKINKAKYDALSDDMKAEYVAGDKDGEFILDVSGLPEPEDTGPLKRALESEKNKHKETKAKLSEAETKIAEFPNVDELKANHEKEVGKYKKFTEKTLIDGVATELASKISTAPKLLAPHIASRLVADLTGDEPVTKVVKDGKPSDMTIDQLREEVVANPDFKAILIGSKASGGGAPKVPAKPLGGGAPKDGEQAIDLSKAPASSLVERIQARKAANAQ